MHLGAIGCIGLKGISMNINLASCICTQKLLIHLRSYIFFVVMGAFGSIRGELP